MVIARAPLRVTFGGGGTDLEAYHARFGGIAISATIDRYVYAVLRPSDSAPARVTSSDPRVWAAGDDALALPRAVLQRFGLVNGVDVLLASDVPSGTGLGSSGAVAVSLACALAALDGRTLPPLALAALASDVELRDLGAPAGLQDPLAAAFGGLNVFRFGGAGVDARPVRLDAAARGALQERLLLLFTGSTRSSADILRTQRDATREGGDVLDALHATRALAERTLEALERGDIDRIGALLDEGWSHKRRFAPGVSNPFLDACYDEARAAGADGGKLVGAGGAGFLLIAAPPERHAAIRAALAPRGLRPLPFRFEYEGARVIAGAVPVGGTA